MPAPDNKSGKRVPLTQGKYAIVDEEDYPYVIRFRWIARQRGNSGVFEAAATIAEGVGTVLLHRFILGDWPEVEIDHIDGDPLNNRRSNLRFCTRAQNARNQLKRKNGSSDFKGVPWNKRNQKWQAHIRVDGRLKALGYFNDPVAAAKVCDKAARRYFGTFANLNFPNLKG